MKLASRRNLAELQAVLKDPPAAGPDPVYWVFSDITEERWENLTVIAEGRIAAEYPKTFGHYHSQPVGEVYHVVAGEGILVLQKKFLEGERWIAEKVSEVILIKAQPGDQIVITPEWGHGWSNIGDLPLLLFDDWRAGHSPRDYEVVKKLHGLAYYLVDHNSQPTAEPNPHYIDLPEPRWLTAEEFKKRLLKLDQDSLTED